MPACQDRTATDITCHSVTELPAGATMIDHKDRKALTGEAHARPTLPGQTPCLAVHEAVLDSQAGLAVLDYVRAMSVAFSRQAPAEDAVHHIIELPTGALKWERHGEFSGYTAISTDPGKPVSWPDGRPGERIAAVRVKVAPGTSKDLLPASERMRLEQADYAASYVTGKKALVASDFKLTDDDFIEFLMWNGSLTERQLGRILRRVFEIETYRVMALLAFPVARALRPRLDSLEAMVGKAIRDLGDAPATATEVEAEERILAIVSGAAQEAEECLADSEFRFAATRAYGGLVMSRLEELREERVEGFQRLGTFLKRRFSPALDTVEAARSRLAAVSARIERASALLRTRTDLERQKHNQNLLGSMDRRAKIQSKLQETVETLSIAAITYYAYSLAVKFLEPLRGYFSEQWNIPKPWQDPLLILVLGIIAFGLTRLVRRRLEKETGPDL